MASPPSLVTLGLTLPDSRILCGIAGIGLTLVNIAIILPHLRQSILDSIHAPESAPAHEQSTQEQIDLSDGSNATQLVDLNVKSLTVASVSPCDRQHQSPPLTCSATVKSVCSVVTEPFGCLGVDSQVALHPILLPPAGKTDNDQILPQTYRSPDVDSSEEHVSSSRLLAQEGRGALHIPLPVPDSAEVAFFDTTDTNLSSRDLGEEYSVAVCEKYSVPEEHSTIELDGPIGIEQGAQLVIADLPTTPGRVVIGEDLTGMSMLVSHENAAPTSTNVTVRDHHNPMTEGTTPHFPYGFAARGDTVQSTRTEHSLVGGKEILAKRRPESLEFVPQSVIRRYPSVPTASAGHYFWHRGFTSGDDHQIRPTPPQILVHNPAMLLEGTTIRPRASCATLEGCASSLAEVHPKRRLMGPPGLIVEIATAQEPLKQGPVSLPPPLAVHELTPLRKYPTHRRRLGVLARAALRNRRSTARRRRNDTIDGSSTSDSDSELDSDSQYSSGSSTDERMLPRMLGADLIAAIDANSESELNLVGSRRATCTPLDVYEDFLVSEDSAADVSMIMHVSSNDDASNSEVRAPATFRSLTYEDIQQWASGVVQKCVRQVCRSRAPVEPLSPSQASDVCAERPSGSGISQCPLSGLHCRLGAAALAEIPAPKTKDLQMSLPLAPTSTPPSRKPLTSRNVRDIPEFVPRQRHVSVTTGRVEGCRRLSTRATVDVTRDVATKVIARMESQAGFDTRQRLVGMDEKRLVSGWRGTLRCA
ncbi:hypothetical protein J3R83DRAFT_4342 [Lanmaoa asiatica]|nr:hypothetical protein J3R83DRAFT_4342 [Lanmaoa asiatica]